MNRLFVDDISYLITPSYKEGAIARRIDSASCFNPYPLSDARHAQWNNGFKNETNLVHVIDGFDLISSEREQSRTFIAGPSLRQSAPKKAGLHYALALMNVSGMKVEAVTFMSKPGVPYPGELAAHLRSKGHSLSHEFADLIIRRVVLEREMVGVSISEKELTKIRSLTNLQQEFLLVLGDIQDAYYSLKPSLKATTAILSKHGISPREFLRQMGRDGLSFLLDHSQYHCRPSAKGWRAIAMLKRPSLDDERTPSPKFRVA
jgi:hypothetical protein